MEQTSSWLKFIVTGILSGIFITTTVSANEAFDYVRNLTDYERASEFAQIVNNTPDYDYCAPSSTEFLGMKPDERAGYLLICSDEMEYLFILYPDRPGGAYVDGCFMAYMMGSNCREMWEELDLYDDLFEGTLE